MSGRRGRDGSALLEVMVALVILATAGVAAAARVAAFAGADRRIEARELEVERAERTLALHALLTGPELERRLGVRRAGGDLVVRVDRPEPSLFRVSVASAEAPDVELLVTVVYRAAAEEDGDAS